jgi:hypothetical protein
MSSLILLGACRAPVTVKPLPSAVVSREYEVLDPKFVQKRVGDLYDDAPGDPKTGEAYRVGPGDGLLVAVYNHPELSLAPYVGTNVSAGQNVRPLGLVVDNDGTTQFPLIGMVLVAGKTSNELRVFLEHELSRYIKDPKVTVQVSFAGSIRYYFLGQFTQRSRSAVASCSIRRACAALISRAAASACQSTSGACCTKGICPRTSCSAAETWCSYRTTPPSRPSCLRA